MDLGSNEELSDRALHVDAVFEDLKKLIGMRTLQLVDVQNRLVHRVVSQDITYFNVVSRKKHISYMFQLHSTLELESKMLRRTIFYLQRRQDRLTLHREDLKQKISDLNPYPTDPSGAKDLAE